jgi:DNA ligase-4
VKRQTIDCSKQSATSDLRRAFAKCITARGEGLVLKADEPYFDFGTAQRPYSCRAIKLKKEYISGFGDIGDFAVVGARFDAAKARTYNIPRLKWTHFYVGCLENKEEVQRFGKRPRFVVTNVVELNATQLATFMSSVNPHSVRPEDNTEISLRIEPGIDAGKRPSVIFPTPPVVDIRCFSFDKNGNMGFWSPRFPSVTKTHCDRTYHDTISFAELQEMAIKEKEMPPPEDSQELLGWIAALEKSEPMTTADTTSQSTVSTVTAPMTPSTRSSQPARTLPSPMLPTTKGPDSTNRPRAAAGGQLTPPRSSLTQFPDPKSAAPVGKQEASTRGQKRPHELSAETRTQETSKIRKCSTDQFDSTVPLPQTDDLRSSTNQREALASVPGSSHRNTDAVLAMPKLANSVSMHAPESTNKEAGAQRTTRPSFPASMSFHEALSTRIAEPPVATALPSGPPNNRDTGIQASGPPTDTTARKCSFLPDSCKLSTFSILLSPCISDFPWVTNDLLSCHGVKDFIRNPKEWLDNPSPTVEPAAQIPTSTSSSAHPNPTSTPNRRRKKIVLIDARRKEASEAFLQSIQDAGLKRPNGDREYVPIYDWRVLEDLRDGERKCGLDGHRPGARFDVSSGQSIWRRFWVGLA